MLVSFCSHTVSNIFSTVFRNLLYKVFNNYHKHQQNTSEVEWIERSHNRDNDISTELNLLSTKYYRLALSILSSSLIIMRNDFKQQWQLLQLWKVFCGQIILNKILCCHEPNRFNMWFFMQYPASLGKQEWRRKNH